MQIKNTSNGDWVYLCRIPVRSSTFPSLRNAADYVDCRWLALENLSVNVPMVHRKFVDFIKDLKQQVMCDAVHVEFHPVNAQHMAFLHAQYTDDVNRMLCKLKIGDMEKHVSLLYQERNYE